MDIWDLLGGLLDGVGVLIGVGALLLGVLAALAWLWGLRALLRRLRESREIAGNWPRTAASIARVDMVPFPLPQDAPRPLAHYSFTVRDRAYAGEDAERLLAAPAVGDTVEVVYDPADPAVNHLSTRIRSRIGSWLALFIVMELALLGCVVLLFWLGIDALI